MLKGPTTRSFTAALNAKSTLALVAAVQLLSVACGSASNPTSPSQFSPPTVLNFSPVVPSFGSGVPGLAWQDVAVFQSGTITATLQWSSPSKDLDLLLTDTLCFPTT